MVQVRFNTNYDVLPDQKRWRVLIDGGQIFTNSVDIRTKSWTTKDLITGEDGNPVEKYHISCKPEIVTTNEDGVQLKDYDDMKEEGPQADMVCIGWSESAKKWRVYIKGDERFFDEMKINKIYVKQVTNLLLSIIHYNNITLIFNVLIDN